jgi:manganese/zinc/iron transport system permease protein
MTDLTAWLTQHYTFCIVTLSTMVLGIVTGIVGIFIFWRRESLLGDMISHAALPGITLMFLITHSTNPLVLLAGGVLSGLLGVLTLVSITKITQLGNDTVIGIILASFFGMGLIGLTLVQQTTIPHQSLLNKFLFGNASTIVYKDLITTGTIAIIILTVIMIWFKELILATFDRQYAQVIGYNPLITDALILTLTVVIVALGLQTVGVVLMSALLIGPAAAAHQWTSSIRSMIVVSSGFGACASALGSIISSLYPHIPTGPTIVIALSMFLLVSFLATHQRRFS